MTKPPTLTITRRLRPTQSELGQIDPAALFEFHRGRVIRYEADDETTCLVDLDEEPPHPLDPEAVDIALTISLLLHARLMDEVHVMRKVVIDGSNTTGFQRTAIVAMNGRVQVGGKEIPIQQVSLEEDSGRKTGENRSTVIFRLDRIGVPLIEVSTGPVITDPQEAERVALAIGQILRSTRRVKRGLGSVRQDLNVSIKGGALTEIKGVQELELVSKAVEFEVQRQTTLLRIRDDLKNRGVQSSDIREEFRDLTQNFSSSDSKVIQSALKQGGAILGVRLAGFKGVLKRELMPGIRLGTEMAKRAAFWGRVGGIFHSDELPAYGLTEKEVDLVARTLECGPIDAFVLVGDLREHALDALKAVVERSREALVGVPEETRTANPDGTSFYMRPRPGAARMYPETDVPPVQINPERIRKTMENLPRSEEDVERDLESKYSLGPKLSNQLVKSDRWESFESIVSDVKGVPASFVATILTGSLRNLSREGVDVTVFKDSDLKQIFRLVEDNKTAKESVLDILRWQSSNPGKRPEEALKELNLGMIPKVELAEIISRILEENRLLVKAKGTNAIDRVMNLVMAAVRGRADPKIVNELLRTQLEKAGM